MNYTEEIKALTDEISSLKVRLSAEIDFREQTEIKREISKIKLKIYDLILSEKKEAVGITAKELFAMDIKKPEYYQTGIRAIDRMGGIPLGAMIQLGASSGAGKTTLMLKILSTFAKIQKVAHFDFEMGLNKTYFKLKKLLKSEAQMNNYIIDFESYKLKSLIREIEIYSAMGVKFFVIDSRMKIKTDEKFIADSTSLISSELQRLCRENNITIILINQMSENALKEGLPTLKGGNDQFYDADLVFFLYKLKKKSEDRNLPQEIDETKRVFWVGKNRYGKEYRDEILAREVSGEESTHQVYMPQMD